MLSENLPEEPNISKLSKLYDIFSPDIDTRQKLNSNNKLNKDLSQISDLFSSPKQDKEMSFENDNDFYSPYVKRTISNVIKHSVKSKFSNNVNNYLTTYKKNISKKFYSPSPNIIKSEKLSDRFIPLNKGTNLMEKFNLTVKFDEADENVNPDKNDNEDNNNDNDNNRNNILYNELLKLNALKENDNTLINK